MEKGHYGHYSGNARHSRVTSHNMDATKRDDEAHMEYLKEDVKYDNKHGHSDIDMTADEKHISKLAGDLKYDEKHHGAAQHHGENGPNYGDIKEAPSKITQFFRGVKYDTSGPKNFLKNIVTVAGIVAPIPSIGKLNAVKNIGKAVSSKVKEAKMFGISKDLLKSPEALSDKHIALTKKIGKAFLNTPKQYSNLAKGKVPKSQPVNVTGPNPAHNIGAGGNSYPK